MGFKTQQRMTLKRILRLQRDTAKYNSIHDAASLMPIKGNAKCSTELPHMRVHSHSKYKHGTQHGTKQKMYIKIFFLKIRPRDNMCRTKSKQEDMLKQLKMYNNDKN